MPDSQLEGSITKIDTTIDKWFRVAINIDHYGEVVVILDAYKYVSLFEGFTSSELIGMVCIISMSPLGCDIVSLKNKSTTDLNLNCVERNPHTYKNKTAKRRYLFED